MIGLLDVQLGDHITLKSKYSYIDIYFPFRNWYLRTTFLNVVLFVI